MPTKEPSLETFLRLWTVEDYHRMVEVGILQPDESVELIAGQIIRIISPQGRPHSSAIRRTRRLLEKALGEQVFVQTQLPIQLNNYSEPEPDVAVVRPDSRDYIDHHPTASDVYLIVEVADSTLKKDRDIKAKEYAASGIEDYWLLDVENRQLYVFQDPTSEGYQQQLILPEDETVTPQRFPEIRVKIQDILPLT
ncbi:MAG: Uma2 family endonuclease [Cyanobacteria bacterium J06592_8]